MLYITTEDNKWSQIQFHVILYYKRQIIIEKKALFYEP